MDSRECTGFDPSGSPEEMRERKRTLGRMFILFSYPCVFDCRRRHRFTHSKPANALCLDNAVWTIALGPWGTCQWTLSLYDIAMRGEENQLGYGGGRSAELRWVMGGSLESESRFEESAAEYFVPRVGGGVLKFTLFYRLSHACSSFIGCICIFLCCVGQVPFDEMVGYKDGRFGISIVFADEGKRVRVIMNETCGRNEVETVYVPLTRGLAWI